MSTPAIRSADSALDGGGCAEIYAPYVADGATSFEERPPGPDEMAARIAERSAAYPWLVAEEGGEVLGYACACRHRERPAYRWAVDVSVYVAAVHHRRGIGRALYESLFDRLRNQGFRIACAGITLPNEASVALHEHLGFAPVGVYRRIGWKQGAWRDVGWWQLQLQPAAADPPPEPLPPESPLPPG
jgi:phosphinothricin acetyltransferase